MKEEDSDDEEEIETYEIILLGDSGVGKEDIIKHLIYGYFKEDLAQSASLTFLEKVIKLDKYGGKEIRFKIRNTPGQEKYSSVAKNYLKNAKAAILVMILQKNIVLKKLKNFGTILQFNIPQKI